MITKEQNQEHFALLLGRRLAFARGEAGLSQKELSQRMGFKDRQILSNIESGNRKVSTDELLKLMEILGRNIEFFTDPLRLIGEGAFSWRAPNTDESLLDAFELKAGAWVSTYRHLCHLSEDVFSPITPQLAMTTKSSFEHARDAAERLTLEWELGTIPAARLAEKVEKQLKILILFVDAPSGISGAACHLPEFNTILINRKDPEGRRNYDLAHELFHVLTWDRLPPRRIDGCNPSGSIDKRIEQLADNFAGALLMPQQHVRCQWESRKTLEIHDRLNDLGLHFRVTAQAMKWRCLLLGLLEKTDLVAIDDTKLSFNGYSPNVATIPRLFSRKFVDKIHWALGNGSLSVRRTAKILDLTINDLTELIRAHNLTVPYDL